MTPQHTQTTATISKPSYDNTALRERIGDAEIATRSIGAELHTAARDAADTEVASRGRWFRRRRP
ncbi:MAG TPA: hypothetical protein VE032_04065 [Actinomycetota bacterium]|nr:hypothetical protein [Actinomycetota bacterium]